MRDPSPADAPQEPGTRHAPLSRRHRAWLSLGAVAAAACLAVAVYAHSMRTQPPAPTTGSAEARAYGPSRDAVLPALWSLPDLTLTDHRGDPVSLRAPHGPPRIADFIFTTCTNACPMMTARMVLVQQRLSGTPVRFVSFSVDPARDHLDALGAYAQRWNPEETRWSVVPTDAARLTQLVDAFRVTASNTGDPENPILHSTVFFLVDGAGQVRGVYASDDADALERLVRDARTLARTADSPDAPTGPRTYASLGCAGCHHDPRIAPPLEGIGGKTRELADGTLVTADAAYLRRALLEPGRERVAGYPLIMPSYHTALTGTEVDALVEELLAMRAPRHPARRASAPRTSTGHTAKAPTHEPAAPSLATDPVCHMEVRVEPSTPRALHEGAAVYFCAEGCRNAFLKDPARYAGAGR